MLYNMAVYFNTSTSTISTDIIVSRKTASHLRKFSSHLLTKCLMKPWDKLHYNYLHPVCPKIGKSDVAQTLLMSVYKLEGNQPIGKVRAASRPDRPSM